jgi:hypothetical protein
MHPERISLETLLLKLPYSDHQFFPGDSCQYLRHQEQAQMMQRNSADTTPSSMWQRKKGTAVCDVWMYSLPEFFLSHRLNSDNGDTWSKTKYVVAQLKLFVVLVPCVLLAQSQNAKDNSPTCTIATERPTNKER